jgi:two-component system, LytTR family, response regulator LytT
MKYKYLIIDDEPLARKLILSHASKVEGLELAGEFGDAIGASNFLHKHRVDLIFLDIQMPEITGLQFISTLKNSPAIILTTAFREFAAEAFDLDVVDYLLKPISFERLLKSVNKFFERKSGSSSANIRNEDNDLILHLKADRKIHKIPMLDVLFVESLDEYVKVYTKGKIIITRENISSLDQKLPGNQFVRIHRSFIVSIKAITTISTEGVEVSSKFLPFGRAFKQGALAMLGMPKG